MSVKRIILVLLLLLSAYANYRLWYSPSFRPSGYGYLNEDVYHQLNFLKEAIDEGADTDMQRYFPEGFVFLNALYGITWCDVAEHLDHGSLEAIEAQSEVQKTYSKLGWATTRGRFSDDMNPDGGVFYAGWKNLLLAKMFKAGLDGGNPQLKQELDSSTTAIVEAFSSSNSQFLESHPGMAWPADNIIAMASVAIYNQTQDDRFKPFLERWRIGLREHLDKNGLIPHQTRVGTDAIVENGRGCSQALILSFLRDIDPELAQKSFATFRKLFLTSRFGLPGVREYPKGVKGYGDVDSGPVILDVGGAASIVSIRVFSDYGDAVISDGLRNSVEMFGVPFSFGGSKKYLFGKMPMADAFIAWSNASIPPKRAWNKVPISEDWRVKVLVPTSVLTLILLVLTLKNFGVVSLVRTAWNRIAYRKVN